MKLFANLTNLFRMPFLMISALTFLLAACNSSKSSGAKVATTSQTAVNSNSSGPDLDLNCVIDHIQNPPESFHYVYKKDTSDGVKVDQEADITPQTIDGFRMQHDGTPQPIHGVRSDSSSWQGAWGSLTGIAGMAGTVATFNHSSAMQREADNGTVNGYDAVHYSIDTARWDETTRQMLGNFALGPGGFDKGDVWVTSAGCPVKLVLDDEMHKKDGSLLEKVHYEVTMVKK